MQMYYIFYSEIVRINVQEAGHSEAEQLEAVVQARLVLQEAPKKASSNRKNVETA